ncbi:MAG: hypothetical protein ACJAT4_001335 [Granulosicoccus sp.]|jgi:hypothetical protein
MKLEFEQTIEHIRDLQKNHFLKNKWIKRFGIFFIIMLAINMYGLGEGKSFKIENLISTILPIFIIGGIWYAIMKFGNKQMTSGKNKDLLTGHRVVEFFDDKIKYKTKIIDTNYQWEAVTSFKESDLCFYLYTGSAQALIIPKSAFINEQQQKEFEDLIKSKVKT